MRKLNISEDKLQELLQVLITLGVTFTAQKDSIEVTVDTLTKKRVVHELSRINTIHKTPPLTYQYDEALSIISIFDLRM